MWILPFALIAITVVALDQISKLLILEFLYEGQLVLIPGVLNFTYVENRGMAFGLLSDQRWVFMILSTVGIIAMCAYLWFFVKSRLARVALSLVIGGGIGNMIDRVAYGFVVDFIDFCAFDFWVWVFNVADAAVCVGAGLFILDLVLETVREIKKKKQTPDEAPQNPDANEETTPAQKESDNG
ncbi:MAG: signal peptidase II [Ruminococcaceae bacterium]|nr:signal peptidase II [Oscillospiraceae bacterium]